MPRFARPLHPPELRPFGNVPAMLHFKTEVLVKRDIMFVGGFQIGRQAIIVGAFQPGADCGSAEALALKGGVASGVMQIPAWFFGQMLLDRIGHFQPANDRPAQRLNEQHDQPRAVPQTVMRLTRPAP